MHTPAVNRPDPAGLASRHLHGPALAAALRDARAQTQRQLAQWRGIACLPGGALPLAAEFNPPAWEAGHIAWFQEWWLARFPAWRDGVDADPFGARTPSWLPGADQLYDSSAVGHDRRWTLELPDAARLDGYLSSTLESTLALLADLPADSTTVEGARGHYFHRLALLHEDMHCEAGIYMANHVAHWPGMGEAADFGVFAAPTQWQACGRHTACADGPQNGHPSRDTGFAFDNELPEQELPAVPVDIDRQAVSVARFLPFVEAGGYQDRGFWSSAGWAAQRAAGTGLPRFHRWHQGALQRCCFGRWRTLAPDEAILHVSAHEAEAWCRWSGRRLPLEDEWRAAAERLPDFDWGRGWEWTASPFLPFPGFRPHPYRDYSQPWFGTHRVLKGASPSTPPRLRTTRFRNFYPPERSDIFSTFRSCTR